MAVIGYDSEGRAIGENYTRIEPENFPHLVELLEEAKDIPRNSNIINMDLEDYKLGHECASHIRTALKFAKQLERQTRGKYKQDGTTN